MMIRMVTTNLVNILTITRMMMGMMTGMMMETTTNFLMFLKIIHILHLTCQKFQKEDRFTWILIWIMKFRSNYNLPNTATEALIKFVKILLKDCENIDHESFPNTL